MANTTKTTTTRSTRTTITKKPPRSTTATRKSSARTTGINPEIRYRMIAEAAYLRAEQRGFSGGDPLDDWLTAERDIDLLLAERATQVTQ